MQHKSAALIFGVADVLFVFLGRERFLEQQLGVSKRLVIHLQRQLKIHCHIAAVPHGDYHAEQIGGLGAWVFYVEQSAHLRACAVLAQISVVICVAVLLVDSGAGGQVIVRVADAEREIVPVHISGEIAVLQVSAQIVVVEGIALQNLSQFAVGLHVVHHIVQHHFGHGVLNLSQAYGHYFALLVLPALLFNPQKSSNIQCEQADEHGNADIVDLLPFAQMKPDDCQRYERCAGESVSGRVVVVQPHKRRRQQRWNYYGYGVDKTVGLQNLY